MIQANVIALSDARLKQQVYIDVLILDKTEQSP